MDDGTQREAVDGSADHTGPTAPTVAAPARPRDPARRPTIAYLSYSSGEFDARTIRMARSAIAAGYDVTVYARWHPGLPPVEERDGYRLVRAPFDWRMAFPLLRGGARRRAELEMAASAREAGPRDQRDAGGLSEDGPGAVPPTGSGLRSFVGRGLRFVTRAPRRWLRLAKMFPLRPLGWAWALESVAEPADIWHGMWAGSLPALARLRRRHGGRTIYDSRDVYMASREYARLGWPAKSILAGLERRWAREADGVLTVNESYADLLVEQLGIPRPPVVMNCPQAWDPPVPAPDLIRDALGLTPGTPVAIYQGHLMGERGIEQTMAAILEVPGAVLALLGFGTWLERLAAETAAPPYLGRVFLLPAVPPDDLLLWTTSADVAVMAIQPTTVNHRFTTPQKLFESMAAGVPVVASDLPGMAEIVGPEGVGVVCDPTSPPAIAAAISTLALRPADERAELRAHVLHVAHERYHWEAQVGTLLALYGRLLPPGVTSPASRIGAPGRPDA